MDKLKIYQKIRDLAHQGEAVYTRADLAYDLQQFGISRDCFEVGLFVWEAYRHFHQDEKIRSFFYDNERKGLLVDEYQADGLIAENQTADLFQMEQQRLAEWNTSLCRVENTLTEVMREGTVRTGGSIASTIIGTKGVECVKQEAATVFNNYSGLVGHYEDARQQIQLLIADFVKVRTYVCDIYRRYSLVLTDAFGDSVKAVAPELFDFDQIEFLDVQGMLQQVQLDYNRINEKCSLLMSDISDSFARSLKNASASYRSAGSKQAGLVLAGLNMLSHYMETSEKVANLKQELLQLKNSVKHDVTQIKGDLGRLCVIYKSLNDVSVPEAEAFCKYAGQVLTDEWRQLEARLYQNGEIRKLKEERDALLDQMKSLEQEMSDEEMNIGYYTTRIGECRQLLDSMQAQYQEARQTKPSKPFFLINWLTFGSAGRSYNRNIYEWNQACKPVITQYENLQVDVKLDSDELTRQQASFKEHQTEYQQLKQTLRQQNKTLMEQIRADRELRLQMLPHLEAMINLLRLARRIANTRLDASLTKAVHVSRQDIRVPEELSQKIGALAQAVRDNVEVTPQMMQHAVDSAALLQRNRADRHGTAQLLNKDDEAVQSLNNGPGTSQHAGTAESRTAQPLNGGHEAAQRPEAVEDRMASWTEESHTAQPSAGEGEAATVVTPEQAGRPEHQLSEQDQAALLAAGNQAVQTAAGFLEAAARLEAMKVQNTIAEQKYNQELAALQGRFHDYLTRIDDKSAVLMKTLRQINTAQNPEQLKNGLLALMGQDGNRISKEDLEDFINGTKTIEL